MPLPISVSEGAVVVGPESQRVTSLSTPLFLARGGGWLAKLINTQSRGISTQDSYSIHGLVRYSTVVFGSYGSSCGEGFWDHGPTVGAVEDLKRGLAWLNKNRGGAETETKLVFLRNLSPAPNNSGFPYPTAVYAVQSHLKMHNFYFMSVLSYVTATMGGTR